MSQETRPGPQSPHVRDGGNHIHTSLHERGDSFDIVAGEAAENLEVEMAVGEVGGCEHEGDCVGEAEVPAFGTIA